MIDHKKRTSEKTEVYKLTLAFTERIRVKGSVTDRVSDRVFSTRYLWLTYLLVCYLTKEVVNIFKLSSSDLVRRTRRITVRESTRTSKRRQRNETYNYQDSEDPKLEVWESWEGPCSRDKGIKIGGEGNTTVENRIYLFTENLRRQDYKVYVSIWRIRKRWRYLSKRVKWRDLFTRNEEFYYLEWGFWITKCRIYKNIDRGVGVMMMESNQVQPGDRLIN